MDIYAEITKRLSPITQYPIYAEKIPQGFQTPCFFIKMVRVSTQKEIGNRYRQIYSIMIRYFPDSDQENEDDVRIGCLLSDELIYLKKSHATDINFEVVDGILNWSADYSYYFQKLPITAHMQNIHLNLKAKQ